MPAIKATIEFETGKTTKKSFSIVIERYSIENHSEYEENQAPVSVQQKKPDKLHIDYYILTYTGAELLPDGTFVQEEIKDARTEIFMLKRLLLRMGELHRQPICEVQWGEECFRGMLTKLDYRYTMYANDGTPVRASGTAEFTEFIDADAALQNDNTPQSPDRTKYRTIYEHTQLFDLAYREYDDPGSWRIIAEANGISDPLDLTTGTLLVLPPDH